LTALCKGDLGQWCHWGATTQDVTDTATILQIRSALELIESEM
jgi:3-carboxy-cis,cis-muconate cycloisomerase